MGTHMGLPPSVGAQAQLPLAAPAGQLTQPHGTCTLPKEGTSGGSQRRPAAQLPAGYCSISQVPSVVAHGPPVPTVPHFQPACAPVGTISQTQPLNSLDPHQSHKEAGQDPHVCRVQGKDG